MGCNFYGKQVFMSMFRAPALFVAATLLEALALPSFIHGVESARESVWPEAAGHVSAASCIEGLPSPVASEPVAVVNKHVNLRRAPYVTNIPYVPNIGADEAYSL
jgi:hypothetical protein